MDSTIQLKHTTPDAFKITPGLAGPSSEGCAAQLAQVHPLKNSELQYDNYQQSINFRMLRNNSGLHAPLKLAMELRSAEKINRLPFLTSSNVQRDVLLGRDEIIQFSDFLGVENDECLGQPHAVVEKTFGF